MENIVQNASLYHIKNDRMAGFVPSRDVVVPQGEGSFGRVLSSYRSQSELPEIKKDMPTEKFGFMDLVDMVNPFQHIPLLNLAYRKITNDEIKPISMIVGGGVFGGPAGVAGGLVNAVIEKETGKDLLGNAVVFAEVQAGKPKEPFDSDFAAYDDLPVALLSFAQTPVREGKIDSQPQRENHYMRLADGRTAGTIAVYA